MKSHSQACAEMFASHMYAIMKDRYFQYADWSSHYASIGDNENMTYAYDAAMDVLPDMIGFASI